MKKLTTEEFKERLNAKYSGESEITYENEKVYISTLNCTIWLQWFRDVNYINIKEINLDINH